MMSTPDLDSPKMQMPGRSKKIKSTTDTITMMRMMNPPKRIPDGTVVQLEKIEDHTTPIWDVIYEMRVPTVATLTELEIARSGLPVTGVKDIDDDVLTRLQTVHISINRAVEVFRQGYTIVIPQLKNAISIYDALQEYIEYWGDQQNGASIHIGTAPMDDLEVMDQLADSLHLYLFNNGKSMRDQHTREEQAFTSILTDAIPLISDLPLTSIDELNKRDARPATRANLLDLFTNGVPDDVNTGTTGWLGEDNA